MKLHESRRFLWAIFVLSCLLNISLSAQSAHGTEKERLVVESQALISVAQRSQGVSIIGIEAENVFSLKVFSSPVNGAALDEFKRGEGALISAKLAQQLSLGLGDVFTLIHPTGENTIIGPSPLVIRYRVLGILDNWLLTATGETVYINRVEAEKFLNSTK